MESNVIGACGVCLNCKFSCTHPSAVAATCPVQDPVVTRCLLVPLICLQGKRTATQAVRRYDLDPHFR